MAISARARSSAAVTCKARFSPERCRPRTTPARNLPRIFRFRQHPSRRAAGICRKQARWNSPPSPAASMTAAIVGAKSPKRSVHPAIVTRKAALPSKPPPGFSGPSWRFGIIGKRAVSSAVEQPPYAVVRGSILTAKLSWKPPPPTSGKRPLGRLGRRPGGHALRDRLRRWPFCSP